MRKTKIISTFLFYGLALTGCPQPEEMNPADPLQNPDFAPEAIDPEPLPIDIPFTAGKTESASATRSLFSHVEYIWVQAVASGEGEMQEHTPWQIRAISKQPCEEIEIDLDAKTHLMKTRAKPCVEFPVWACTLDLPSTTSHAFWGKTRLPLPSKASLPTIGIVGDTGCHLNTQSCDAHWKFAQMADHLASRPVDLLIHVGDYFYRYNCKHKGCQHEPMGDKWEAWRADFFEPAQKLLSTAPFIFVRGNHEACPPNKGPNAYKGWFRFLDAEKWNKGNSDAADECRYTSGSFSVELGHFQSWVIDSSGAKERKADEGQAANYAQTLSQWEHLSSLNNWSQTWLISHRPFWGEIKPCNGWGCDPTGVFYPASSINPTLQSAFAQTKPKNTGYVLSGHIHLFEILSFQDQLPLQVIVGNSGADLTPTGWFPRWTSIDARKSEQEISIKQYGYVTLKPAIGPQKDKTWELRLWDGNGKEVSHYTLYRNSLHYNLFKQEKALP